MRTDESITYSVVADSPAEATERAERLAEELAGAGLRQYHVGLPAPQGMRGGEFLFDVILWPDWRGPYDGS